MPDNPWTSITPADVDTLAGDELAVAVAFYVEGDDGGVGENRVRIAEAVWNFTTNCNYGAYKFLLSAVADNCPFPPELCEKQCQWIWDNRSQPCLDQHELRAILEAHVAAYRAAPPKLTADYALAMLKSSALHSAIMSVNTNTGEASATLGSCVGRGPDLPTAIFRARVKVAMRLTRAAADAT